MSSTFNKVVTVTRFKPQAYTKVGLRLRVDPDSHRLLLVRVADDSPFCNSKLQPGMYLLSINGIDTSTADMAASEASALIQCIQGNLTIQASFAPLRLLDVVPDDGNVLANNTSIPLPPVVTAPPARYDENVQFAVAPPPLPMARSHK